MNWLEAELLQLVIDMKNSFAALQQDNDSSDSDVEDIPESEYRNDSVPSKQSGGDLILRVDPLVGLKVNSTSSSSVNTLPVELGFDNNDLAACIRVIDALGSNPNLFKLPALKSLRGALHPLIMEQMKNYDVPTTKSNDRRKRRRKDELTEEEERAMLRQERDAKLEAEYINQTQLRAIRLQQLEALNATEGLENIPRVPDGVALIKDGNDSCNLLLTNGSAETKHSTQKTEATKILRDSISCYICHKPYKELHHFYHQLCPDCAAFNFLKRNEMVDMTGKVCIVTGARAKIGYQAALKLLRCGAYVIATTRFPVDACKRYQAESDSPKWVHRLHVYGLDFRDMNGLEAFCAFVESHYERLDVIINNAAQTVRRPPAYYAHLIAGEEYPVESSAADNPVLHSMLSGQILFKTSGMQSNFAALENGKEEVSESERSNLFDGESSSSSVVASSSAKAVHLSANTLTASSAMTQLCTTPEDNLLQQASLAASSGTSNSGSDGAVVAFGSSNSILFPKGATDVNNQQVDLRKTNSWTMKLHEVSTAEMAEVFAINAIAPAVINARLKKMMERHMDDYKFIVNVSAMEGKFYRYKSENHPHTNMAKASLNMMTRTSAQDYVKSNIYMTCVDTGECREFCV